MCLFRDVQFVLYSFIIQLSFNIESVFLKPITAIYSSMGKNSTKWSFFDASFCSVVLFSIDISKQLLLSDDSFLIRESTVDISILLYQKFYRFSFAILFRYKKVRTVRWMVGGNNQFFFLNLKTLLRTEGRRSLYAITIHLFFSNCLINLLI